MRYLFSEAKKIKFYVSREIPQCRRKKVTSFRRSAEQVDDDNFYKFISHNRQRSRSEKAKLLSKSDFKNMAENFSQEAVKVFLICSLRRAAT